MAIPAKFGTGSAMTAGAIDLASAEVTGNLPGEIMTFAGVTAGTVPVGFTIRGNVLTASAITHVKFAASSGNITSGTIRMYGFANA